MKVFVKNYVKDGKKTQMLCILNPSTNVYEHYFVNYSKNKNSVYLTPTKDVK